MKVGDRLGRFELVRSLGKGSHGVVFEARDTMLGERVAIKALHPWLSGDETLRERFKRELILTRRVSHPGVCRLYDMHEEAETLFISMQFVEGRTLSQVIKSETVDPARCVALMRGICGPLAAAHEAGIIHRDLKPGNVLVGDNDRVVVLDFGIATATGVGQLTSPGQALGSVPFIPPEVWEGGSASALGDQYAAGVIAFAALTRELPYTGRNPLEIVDAIRGPRPSLRAKNPEVSEALEAVVLRGMAVRPADRFPDMGAFDAALATALLDSTAVSVSGAPTPEASVVGADDIEPLTAAALDVQLLPSAVSEQAPAPSVTTAPFGPASELPVPPPTTEARPSAPATDEKSTLAQLKLPSADEHLAAVNPFASSAPPTPAGTEPPAAPSPAPSSPPSISPSIPPSGPAVDRADVDAMLSSFLRGTGEAAVPPSAGSDVVAPAELSRAQLASPGEASRGFPVAPATSPTSESHTADAVPTIDPTQLDVAPAPRSDTVRSDTVRSDTVRSDTVRSDTVRSDTVRSDTVRSDTVVLRVEDARPEVASDAPPGRAEKTVVLAAADLAPPPSTTPDVTRVAARPEATVVMRVREIPLEPPAPSRRGPLIAAVAVLVVVAVGAVVALGGGDRQQAAIDAGVADAVAVAPADAGAAMAPPDAPAEAPADAGAVVATADAVVDAGTLELALGGRDAAVDGGSAVSVGGSGAPPRSDVVAPAVEVVSDAPLRQLLGQSRAKGLRAGDVPAFDAAIARGQQAARAKNKAGVAASAAAARAALDAVVVDRGFVSDKLARFNRAFADAKDAAVKEQLKPLSREVLGRIGKKDWAGANETLNVGFTKLAKGR